MRLFQLLILALLATAARADLSLTGTVTILEFNPGMVLYHSDSECSGGSATVFALCDANFDNGRLTLNLEDSGSGCDGCEPTFGAENTAVATFTDEIIFYGPAAGTAAVTWFFESDLGLVTDLELPIAIQFNTPYTILLSLSGSEAAFGAQGNGDSGAVAIEGFLLFNSSDPVCSTITTGVPSDGGDPACGTPEDVSIHTKSGFLYGGHVPEPASLWLLATAGIAWLGAGWRRNAQ